MSPVIVHSPEGPSGTAPVIRAAMPQGIARGRLAVLDNGKPNAGLLLSVVASRLGPRLGLDIAMTIRKGTAATPAEPEIVEEVVAEADLVLTGCAD